MNKNIERIAIAILGILSVSLVLGYYIDDSVSRKSKLEVAGAGMATVFINGNDDDFYGYENGILVAGKLFDDYRNELIVDGKMDEAMAASYEPTHLDEANFNHKDWVKKCRVTIFDSDGQKRFSDRVGLRISGNASRTLPQKSFLLMLGKQYGSKNNGFYIDLGDGDMGYSKLRVHSGGQDLEDTQIRDGVFTEIAKRCGIELVKEEIPAMIWLNDEFYGIGDLETQINEEYLSRHYNIEENAIEIMDDGIRPILNHMGFEDEKVYDFENEELRGELESKVDVYNLIEYIAFNILLDNYDWPFNNVMTWRYTGEEKKDNSFADGRFRFIVSDLDVALKQDAEDPFNMIDYGDNGADYYFIKSILSYKPYRDYFVNVLMDYITVSLDEEYLINLVDDVESNYGEAFKYAAANSPFSEVRGYLNNHAESVDYLKRRLIERKGELYDHIYQFYNSGEGYVLNAFADENSIIQVSKVKVSGENYSSVRSLDCETSVLFTDKNGAPLEKAYINGVEYNTDNGKLSISGDYSKDGVVNISSYKE